LSSDPVRVALIVAEALEACGVRYLVGGSLASAVSGEPRSTLDVDMVVELTEEVVERLTAALGDRIGHGIPAGPSRDAGGRRPAAAGAPTGPGKLALMASRRTPT
jgi:hypothetical protein